MPVTTRHNQKGAALPAVLGVAAILGLMAAAFVQTARYNSLTTRHSVKDIELSYLAKAASERTIADLLTTSSQIPRDGTPYRFSLGEYDSVVRLWDEKGKLDLNFVPASTLEAIINLVAEETSLNIDTDKIVDAILERRRAQARNGAGAFRSIYDLSQIEGVSDALFEMLNPYITVASYSPRVNLAFAEEPVLRSLPGISNADVNRVLNAKETGDEFSVPSVAAWSTSVTGPFYRIYTEVSAPNGQTSARDITVWVQETGEPKIIETRPVY